MYSALYMVLVMRIGIPLQSPLLIAQLASTLPMTGLIWLIQIVSYPLFAYVDKAAFAEYHANHTRLIGFVVGPLMLLEMGASLGYLACETVPRWQRWGGLGLTLMAWVVTVVCSVPMHNRLSTGFNIEAHRALVQTNWLRVLAWSLRSVMLLAWLSRVGLERAQ
jgi:hypothetical protein